MTKQADIDLLHNIILCVSLMYNLITYSFMKCMKCFKNSSSINEIIGNMNIEYFMPRRLILFNLNIH